MNTDDRSLDYYCNQKFWWLSVDLEKTQYQSCCTATPGKISLEWLEKNPTKLFNIPELVQERSDMLAGKKLGSCQSCWSAEQQGLPSRRLDMEGKKITHRSLQSSVESLNLILDTHCNMTCVYCCKHYSSSWRRDILDHGEYSVDVSSDRYTKNNKDIILQQVGQKQRSVSGLRQHMLKSIRSILETDPIKDVMITGGEPFLHNDLLEILDYMPSTCEVKIYTGLGVNEKRFDNLLERIRDTENLQLVISAESTEQLYEVVRYGNSWQRFLANLESIKQRGIKFSFSCTLSNLSVIGFKRFCENFPNIPYTYQLCSDPDFLSVHVLDDHSKKTIREELNYFPSSIAEIVSQSLEVTPTAQQISNFKIYFKEFCRRRSITTDWLPTSLREFLLEE